MKNRRGCGGGENIFVFFFFKQKTAYEIGTGDWSSDVCSSDLLTLSLSSSSNTKNYSTVATTVSCMAVNCAEMIVYGSNNGSEAQKIELTQFCYFIDQ